MLSPGPVLVNANGANAASPSHNPHAERASPARLSQHRNVHSWTPRDTRSACRWFVNFRVDGYVSNLVGAGWQIGRPSGRLYRMARVVGGLLGLVGDLLSGHSRRSRILAAVMEIQERSLISAATRWCVLMGDAL
jgi:hypothetical protein